MVHGMFARGPGRGSPVRRRSWFQFPFLSRQMALYRAKSGAYTLGEVLGRKTIRSLS